MLKAELGILKAKPNPSGLVHQTGRSADLVASHPAIPYLICRTTSILLLSSSVLVRVVTLNSQGRESEARAQGINS